jgi:hypothetical protein
MNITCVCIDSSTVDSVRLFNPMYGQCVQDHSRYMRLQPNVICYLRPVLGTRTRCQVATCAIDTQAGNEARRVANDAVQL